MRIIIVIIRMITISLKYFEVDGKQKKKAVIILVYYYNYYFYY